MLNIKAPMSKTAAAATATIANTYKKKRKLKEHLTEIAITTYIYR